MEMKLKITDHTQVGGEEDVNITKKENENEREKIRQKGKIKMMIEIKRDKLKIP